MLAPGHQLQKNRHIQRNITERKFLAIDHFSLSCRIFCPSALWMDIELMWI